MGKIKDRVQDWLEDYGYELGYDINNCPDMIDWDIIQQNNIDAFTYYIINILLY